MQTLVENLKVQIIEQLNLVDVQPNDIDENAPLFGAGLGLDSIDALEIVVLLEQHYGIKTDPNKSKEAFTSVATLAAFIVEEGELVEA
jgi:acyl carrier protein